MTPYYEDAEAGIVIYLGDCRDVLPTLADGSVDLVLTDPPYGAEFEPAVFGAWPAVARTMAVGASLVTLCGNHQAPRMVSSLDAVLRYWWLCGMSHDTHVRYPGKWVASCWKPALWYVKERRRPGDTECPLDLRSGRSRDKRYHEWGQPIDWFRHWIARLCPPSGAVLDPFMGSGTTLRAAKDLGRKAIGIETELRYVDIAVTRLQQAVLPLGAAS